jgi:hypothetical protein
VLCAIYKLAHGTNLLVCSELFVIGKLIVSKMLHELMASINLIYKKLITWLMGVEMNGVMEKFE